MIARQIDGEDEKSTNEKAFRKKAFRKKANKARHYLVFIVQRYGSVVKCNNSYRIINRTFQFIYELDLKN